LAFAKLLHSYRFIKILLINGKYVKISALKHTQQVISDMAKEIKKPDVKIENIDNSGKYALLNEQGKPICFVGEDEPKRLRWLSKK
jgi:hypothetical protein